MNEHEETKPLWEGQHLRIAARGHWEYVSRRQITGAVGIVAVTPDDRVLLVEQYRPPVDCPVVELPAGLAGDIAGQEDEPLVEAAKRELLEETGYRAESWTRLTCGFSSPGMTDEEITLFLAQGLRQVEAGGGDASESIVVHRVPRGQLLSWLDRQQQRGVQADLKLLAGLFAAQQHLP